MPAMMTSIRHPYRQDIQGILQADNGPLINSSHLSTQIPTIKQAQYHVLEVNSVTSLFDESSESEAEREVEIMEPIKDISSPQLDDHDPSCRRSSGSRRNSTIPRIAPNGISTSNNSSTQRSRSQSATREGRTAMPHNPRSSSTTRAPRPRIDTDVYNNAQLLIATSGQAKSLSKTSSPVSYKTFSPVERKARSPLSNKAQGAQNFPTTSRRIERGISPQEPRKTFQFPLNNLSSMVEHVNSPAVTVLSPVNETFDRDMYRHTTAEHTSCSGVTRSASTKDTPSTLSDRKPSPSDNDRSCSSKLECPASFRSTSRIGLGLNTTTLTRSSSSTSVDYQKGVNAISRQEVHNVKSPSENGRYLPGHRRTISDQDSVTSPQSIQNLIWSPSSNISSESDITDSPELSRHLSRSKETKMTKRRSLITNNRTTNSFATTPISATRAPGLYSEIKDDYRDIGREISHAAMVDREKKKITSLVGRARSATRGLGIISSSSDKENLPRARNSSVEVQRPLAADDNELWW